MLLIAKLRANNTHFSAESQERMMGVLMILIKRLQLLGLSARQNFYGSGVALASGVFVGNGMMPPDNRRQIPSLSSMMLISVGSSG